jgi:hypothetical protein
MKELIDVLDSNGWIGIVTAIVTLSSAITAVTPTPQEGTVLSKVYKLIEILALNILKAKDK